MLLYNKFEHTGTFDPVDEFNEFEDGLAVGNAVTSYDILHIYEGNLYTNIPIETALTLKDEKHAFIKFWNDEYKFMSTVVDINNPTTVAKMQLPQALAHKLGSVFIVKGFLDVGKNKISTFTFCGRNEFNCNLQACNTNIL